MDTQKLALPFAVSFWVFVDRPSSHTVAPVFEIWGRASICLRVAIATDSVLIQYQTPDVIRMSRLEWLLPERKWSTVLIRLFAERGTVWVCVVIDDPPGSVRRFDFGWKGFEDGPLALLIGGGAIAPVYLASLAIYTRDVSSDDIATLAAAGPRHVALDPHASLSLTNRNGAVALSARGRMRSRRCRPRARRHSATRFFRSRRLSCSCRCSRCSTSPRRARRRLSRCSALRSTSSSPPSSSARTCRRRSTTRTGSRS
jgi:hypothetical protein